MRFAGIPALVNQLERLEEDNRKLKTSIKLLRIGSCVLAGLLIAALIYVGVR